MSVTQTEYGYKSEKDINAGVKELRVLLSDPKNLSTTYYQTLEKSDKVLKYTDSARSSLYAIELLEAIPSGPIVYKFTWDMPNMICKSSKMEIYIEPKDDIKTRMQIKCTRIDLQFAEQMQATLHYLPKDTLESFVSVMQELTIFQSMIEQAINTNLPYIRDAIIVKGTYVGTHVDIKDSVIQRSNLNLGGNPPSNVHIRNDGDYVPTQTEIKNSVVMHSDIGDGSNTNVDGSVVIGKGDKDHVDGAAKCLGNPNLETYRRSLAKAMADGNIAESEDKMLRVLRNSLGITILEHDHLLEEIKLATDKNYQTYKQVLSEAMVDGAVDPDEVSMLEALRESLGISEHLHAKAVADVRREKGC
jgi:hypothetical protein